MRARCLFVLLQPLTFACVFLRPLAQLAATEAALAQHHARLDATVKSLLATQRYADAVRTFAAQWRARSDRLVALLRTNAVPVPPADAAPLPEPGPPPAPLPGAVCLPTSMSTAAAGAGTAAGPPSGTRHPLGTSSTMLSMRHQTIAATTAGGVMATPPPPPLLSVRTGTTSAAAAACSPPASFARRPPPLVLTPPRAARPELVSLPAEPASPVGSDSEGAGRGGGGGGGSSQNSAASIAGACDAAVDRQAGGVPAAPVVALVRPNSGLHALAAAPRATRRTAGGSHPAKRSAGDAAATAGRLAPAKPVAVRLPPPSPSATTTNSPTDTAPADVLVSPPCSARSLASAATADATRSPPPPRSAGSPGPLPTARSLPARSSATGACTASAFAPPLVLAADASDSAAPETAMARGVGAASGDLPPPSEPLLVASQPPRRTTGLCCCARALAQSRASSRAAACLRGEALLVFAVVTASRRTPATRCGADASRAATCLREEALLALAARTDALCEAAAASAAASVADGRRGLDLSKASEPGIGGTSRERASADAAAQVPVPQAHEGPLATTTTSREAEIAEWLANQQATLAALRAQHAHPATDTCAATPASSGTAASITAPATTVAASASISMSQLNLTAEAAAATGELLPLRHVPIAIATPISSPGSGPADTQQADIAAWADAQHRTLAMLRASHHADTADAATTIPSAVAEALQGPPAPATPMPAASVPASPTIHGVAVTPATGFGDAGTSDWMGAVAVSVAALRRCYADLCELLEHPTLPTLAGTSAVESAEAASTVRAWLAAELGALLVAQSTARQYYPTAAAAAAVADSSEASVASAGLGRATAPADTGLAANAPTNSNASGDMHSGRGISEEDAPAQEEIALHHGDAPPASVSSTVPEKGVPPTGAAAGPPLVVAAPNSPLDHCRGSCADEPPRSLVEAGPPPTVAASSACDLSPSQTAPAEAAADATSVTLTTPAPEASVTPVAVSLTAPSLHEAGQGEAGRHTSPPPSAAATMEPTGARLSASASLLSSAPSSIETRPIGSVSFLVPSTLLPHALAPSSTEGQPAVPSSAPATASGVMPPSVSTSPSAAAAPAAAVPGTATPAAATAMAPASAHAPTPSSSAAILPFRPAAAASLPSPAPVAALPTVVPARHRFAARLRNFFSGAAPAPSTTGPVGPAIADGTARPQGGRSRSASRAAQAATAGAVSDAPTSDVDVPPAVASRQGGEHSISAAFVSTTVPIPPLPSLRERPTPARTSRATSAPRNHAQKADATRPPADGAAASADFPAGPTSTSLVAAAPPAAPHTLQESAPQSRRAVSDAASGTTTVPQPAHPSFPFTATSERFAAAAAASAAAAAGDGEEPDESRACARKPSYPFTATSERFAKAALDPGL